MLLSFHHQLQAERRMTSQLTSPPDIKPGKQSTSYRRIVGRCYFSSFLSTPYNPKSDRSVLSQQSNQHQDSWKGSMEPLSVGQHQHINMAKLILFNSARWLTRRVSSYLVDIPQPCRTQLTHNRSLRTIHNQDEYHR